MQLAPLFSLVGLICLILPLSALEDHSTTSFYAIDTRTGAVVLEQDSEKSLLPSSCLKIVTTAAALHILGPDGYFETRLEYDGTITNEGVLIGNIYITGGGDPCLGSGRIPPSLSWDKQIKIWNEAIKTAGIRRVRGRVIADTSRWEKAAAVPSWAWEDIGNYYGAGASALSFHENFYTLYFMPGLKVGENAQIVKTDPPISHLVFENDVKTGPEGSGDRACIFGMEFSPIQYVRGTIPAGAALFAIKGALPDPSSVCTHLLTLSLEEKGIQIEGEELTPAVKKTLHITRSPSIKDITHATNQKSINLYAEHLLKKLGEVQGKEGSTASGLSVLKNFLQKEGIPLSGLFLADGSGLSRKNLITTKQLVQLLCTLQKKPYYPDFFSSLPKVRSSISAKSGSMSLAKGYVGYAGPIAFAILINQCPDRDILEQKIDAFFTQLEMIAAEKH